MEHKKEQQFIFTLIDSALNGIVWKEIPEGLDWKYLYTLCQYHKIGSLAAYALDYADTAMQNKIPANIREAFSRVREKGAAREATQYFSLEELQQKFEEQGIYNIPLKGVQLKEYYPSPDMRFLTDLDILCHQEDTEKIARIMEELGYTMKHGGGHHDVYVREPFMTVEIHWICSTDNQALNKFFASIWKRAVKWENYSCSYRMKWEDYYIYMAGHMAKHLKYGGIGIRMILDFYIFEQVFQNSCDWNYIETHLERAGLLTFSRTMSRFLRKCFKKEALTSQEEILMEHVLESGAYGIPENHSGVRFLKNGGKKHNILKNRCLIYVQIFFPPLKSMQQMYPYLKKCPFLLPAAWLERLLKKILFENRKSRSVLKNAGDTRYLKKMDRVCRAAGLY